ncbi:MAG: hypothetical protein V7642_4381 [Burkholderiales bacterium]|jgi:hypothetical protein
MTEFDHAVVIVRDRLQTIAGDFAARGFTLSELATHNLGTSNRLMVLDSSYIELLGWFPGEQPTRKDVVDAVPGLEALVFRSHDAHATHDRLTRAGFKMRPVEELTRPAQYNGTTVQARFLTVRFEQPPLPGIRMYFCQHLTPEYVWRPDLMRHANGMQRLVQISAYSPDPSATAACVAAIADVPMTRDGSAAEVSLANLCLRIEADPALAMARLHGATLVARDDSSLAMDLTEAALPG